MEPKGILSGKEPAFLFDPTYFTAPGLLSRIDHDLKQLRGFILTKSDQNVARLALNSFMAACYENIKDQALRIHMRLEFYQTLGYYGEIYASEQTFINVLADFEKPEIKNSLFAKNPGRANIVYGDILLKYYGLKNDRNEGWFKYDTFDIIAKAKFHILKAYTQSIEGANALSVSDKNYCLVLMSVCFLHLSRWFEPIYYSNLLKKGDRDDVNYEYITARNLEALKEKTCLDYNGQLLLRILDCCDRLKNKKNVDSRIYQQAIEVEQKCLADIKQAGLSINELRKHQIKVNERKRNENQYFKYCIDNQLFLNEHAFFCDCSRSIGDALVVKTQHTHTQIEWVQKFEGILQMLMTDYAIARGHLYEAESRLRPFHFYKNENRDTNSLQLKKDALLKQAFKMCYSILDQIASTVFEVLEIDIKKHLTEKAEAEKRPIEHVYFLNMWEIYPFKEEDFKNNLYLISLLSIAKDLDRADTSALQSFKKYRNAMEHQALFVKDSDTKMPDGIKIGVAVKRSALIGKTKLLMVLTKSAIFSFAYLVRRQSKIKAPQ